MVDEEGGREVGSRDDNGRREDEDDDGASGDDDSAPSTLVTTGLFNLLTKSPEDPSPSPISSAVAARN